MVQLIKCKSRFNILLELEEAVAIILAAGKGTRMKCERAKVLHPVGGVPMVEMVLRACKKAGIRKMITVIGDCADQVKGKIKFEGNTFALQSRQLGTADAVKATSSSLKSLTADTIIAIVCGDTPLVHAGTLQRLIEEVKDQQAELAVLTCSIQDPSGYGRIVRKSDQSLLKIVEEKDCTNEQLQIREINTGFYAVRAAALLKALAQVSNNNAKGEYYLTDIVEAIGCSAKTVTVTEADAESVMGINNQAQLAHANKIQNQRNLRSHMDNGVTILSPENTWLECDVEIGADTVVHPFSVIRNGVRIGRHCEVGPFCQLRQGTVLHDRAEVGNFMEVKKSTLGSGTKAKHLSYIGDTTIGQHVNIGAGTITANYDGKNKHKTVIKDGAHIGSNCTIVAPVTIGKNAVTGAGSVIIRGNDVADNTVVVGVPAKPLKKES
ncbi:bifunctional N-acetylglucosamine-1-phosphate uridyltransferase/glucosamine-1-phosphate acetyltransferase [Planctomycetota bacterium]